jgi:hypothetical protein
MFPDDYIIIDIGLKNYSYDKLNFIDIKHRLSRVYWFWVMQFIVSTFISIYPSNNIYFYYVSRDGGAASPNITFYDH